MIYEVLSPAGDFDSLKAAINSNAQAVYLGLSNFNARKNATNFNKDNIRSAVELAHIYNVKVYVTLNTLVKDEEYKELIDVVKYAIEAKVDAFIVQDLGVVKVLKENFKNIVMHASTQMGCHNLKGAKVLEKLGFSRVTLSRETRLEDIKLIKENTNLEIEYFVQGALCISFSGNCYLSAFTNQESGNRGRCKQLCRFEYNANSNEKKYYLSARDQSLIYEMKNLLDAGVTSFKIEGRMRHPGYVATSTSVYNSILKSIVDKKDIDLEECKKNLMEAYSRGEYLYHSYLDKTPDDVVNTEFQNHRGLKIGKVINSRKFKDIYEILIESNHDISSGDGLKIITDNKEVCSLGVGNVNKKENNRYVIYSKKYLEKNSDIYLILNASKEKELLDNIRKIDISVSIEAKTSYPLTITFNKDNISYKYISDFYLSEAINCPISKKDIELSISRLNDERFNLTNINIDMDKVFIPKSVLNNARRISFEGLKNNILKENEKDNSAIFIKDTIDKSKTSFSFNKNILIFSDEDINYIPFKDDICYIYSPSLYSYNNIKKIFDILKENNITDYGLNQPMISLNKDFDLIDNLYSEYEDMILLSNNISGSYYALNNKRVIASYNMNIFSSYSIKMYKDLGFINVTSSIEQNKSFIDSNKDVYVYSLGYNVLMNFAHCPYKTVYKNTCDSCSFNNKLSYSQMRIRRYKESLCAFELLSKNPINVLNIFDNPKVIDIRSFVNQIKKDIKDYLLNKNKLIINNETQGLYLISVK